MKPAAFARRLLAGARRALARPTATQLTAAMAVLAALALGGSLLVTGLAVRADQREKAAIAALQDFADMAAKLGTDDAFTVQSLTDTDAAWLSAWLEAFQNRPGETRSLEEACRTGRGGAAVRLIEAPGVKLAGLADLSEARAERLAGLGEGVFAIHLPRGRPCPRRAVEVVAVRRPYGDLTVTVGRIVERPGAAWGWAALAVLATGGLFLASGLTAATLARRRLTAALEQLSFTLDRAAVGDFAHRAPEVGVAPELTALTMRVNRTLDRLEELLSWLRDTSDQLAHDFRTPLARAATRLERLGEAPDAGARERLLLEARDDLASLSRAMNEALSLRDGEAWAFEAVRLDALAAGVAELYQPVAEQRGVRIVTELEPIEILGVRTLLQRAAANLIDNAVKYSPDGGVVRLTVRREDGRAVLQVADQGPGVDPLALDDPARRGVGGRESHGMGLPFVRAIVRRHGGEMAIENAAPGAVVTARF